LFTGDPDVVKAGLGRRALRPILGESSVLVLDGQRHLTKRKLLLPPFHGERMQAYGEQMHAITNDVIDHWSVGEYFALAPSMQRITLRVILRTVFGIEDATEMHELEDLLARIVESSSSSWQFFPAILGVDPLRAAPWLEAARLKKAIDRRLYEQIARRRRETTSRDDILSLLVNIRDESGRGFSDEEIRDELMTVLLAGHETTATGLAWTIGLLLRNPTVLARTRDELTSVTSQYGLDLTGVAKLDWLDAVVREGLRLRPVVPQVSRTLRTDFTLGEFRIRRGTRVTASIYLTHHRADLYPSPRAFDPSRFLGAKVDPYAFLPFGGGIRRCLGMAFALFEMKIVLATILTRACLEADASDSLRAVRRTVTMAPANGVRVKLVKRIGSTFASS
jgi:cytochrome P450